MFFYQTIKIMTSYNLVKFRNIKLLQTRFSFNSIKLPDILKIQFKKKANFKF